MERDGSSEKDINVTFEELSLPHQTKHLVKQ